MNDTEKMQRAADLIKNKQYEQARTLLQGINNPQAQRWLAKIDQVSTEKPTKKARPATEKSSGSRGGILLLVLLVLVGMVILVGVVAVLFLNSSSDEEVITEATATEIPATDLPPTEIPATDLPPTEIPATEIPTAEVLTPEVTEEPTTSNAPEQVQILDAFSPAVQQKTITLEVVNGWGLAPEDSFGASLKLGDDYAGTGVTITRISPDLGITDLKAYAEATLGTDQLIDLKSTIVQGRTIWIREVETPTGRIDTYYVQDSDGDMAIFSTLPTVLKHDDLQQDLAFIASTLEIE